MAAVLGKRQAVQPSNTLAEIVLINEIRATLPVDDPLHSKIVALFDDDTEANHTWNQQYDAVLAQARRRIV